MVVDHDGNKWLGTVKYGLIKFDGDTFTVFNYEGKNYWMASNNGLVKKDGGDISAVFFREGTFKNVISDIALEGKTLWIATNVGLIKYEP